MRPDPESLIHLVQVARQVGRHHPVREVGNDLWAATVSLIRARPIQGVRRALVALSLSGLGGVIPGRQIRAQLALAVSNVVVWGAVVWAAPAWYVWVAAIFCLAGTAILIWRTLSVTARSRWVHREALRLIDQIDGISPGASRSDTTQGSSGDP